MQKMRCTKCEAEFYEDDAGRIRNYGHEPDELCCPWCGGEYDEIEDCPSELEVLALMARRA
jgi:hypothetical protein